MNLKKISLISILILIITVSAVSATENITYIENTDNRNLQVDISGNSVSDIQSAIDSAKDGDTINLGENKEYNIYQESITINKKITLKGDNVTITASSASGAISIRQSSDITISGITFINPIETPKYGEADFSGKAIYTQGSNNIIIDNCTFLNYRYGVEMYTTQDATIRNSYFNGSTVNVDRLSGTKAIQLMGSKNINIINNTFEGNILDGLSIAATSSNINIENNTFTNNIYPIFYGGASTEGNRIRNNRFTTCGMVNETVYNTYLKRNITVLYENLPYISLQKASNDIEITANEFIVKNNNIIIISEAENTAHGFPSTIGGINITNNIVKRADDNVDGSTVTFYYINVLQSLTLKPTDDIVLKDNNFTGIPGINNLKFEFGSIATSGNDVTIPKSKSDTYLSVDYVKDGRVIIALYNINGNTISNQEISYTIDGTTKTDTTDEYGHIYINGLSGSVKIDAKFKENKDYYASTLSATVQLGSAQTATKITASPLTVNAASAKGAKYQFKLTDSNGNPLDKKSVSVTFDGKIYAATTDSKGVASFILPAANAGKYQITLAFTGSSSYEGNVAVSTINIAKQATKLSVAKKTFKKSATKKVTAVLKDNKGKVLNGKKLTMKVNGKTYKATTNKKGVATFTVKLTKTGTFTATTKFAGDNYYTAKSLNSKIIVK